MNSNAPVRMGVKLNWTVPATSRKAAAAVAESKPETKPARKRREMSAAEKKAVSERSV